MSYTQLCLLGIIIIIICIFCERYLNNRFFHLISQMIRRFNIRIIPYEIENETENN